MAAGVTGETGETGVRGLVGVPGTLTLAEKEHDGVEDELLDAEALAELEAQGVELPIIGEGALMAQLSRKRDRTMHSIVATIQAEQDRAIRAPSRGVTTISGGPGTGKTTHAELLAQESPVPLKHINVGDLVKEKGLYEEYDDEWQSYTVDEDKVRQRPRPAFARAPRLIYTARLAAR